VEESKTFDPYEVRKDFPILERKINEYPLIYFDNAATSQKPRQVIEAIKKFYEEHNANIHRAVHTLSQESTELYERAHEETAALVVTTLMEHHSNIVPWEMLSKLKGFKVKYAELNDDGSLNFESMENLVTKKTKLVCISHMSNLTGLMNDVEKISELAHENGALILVDGAQSVPRLPTDVKKLNIDFLAFSGHKMLGPTGIGVLYGKQELLQQMAPFLGGGDMISEVKYDQASRSCQIKWNELPWKFEAGTSNVCGAVGLMEAIRYLKNLGMENVWSYEKELMEYALKRFEELKRTRILGSKDPSNRGGILPFNIEGLNPHDVALLLDQFGIMVRSGFHCAQPLHERLSSKGSVRASFYIYNTKEEIDRFVEVLKEIENV